MASTEVIFQNTGDIFFIVLYLFSLIAIGFYGKSKRDKNSLNDFYLGRGFGFFLLFLTFYATQYSGNTIIGFTGKAYREGWFGLNLVALMVAVIGGLLLYAPKLYQRSQNRNYVTLSDYIDDRYAHKWLHYLIIAVCVFVLGNYVLSNLKAVGYIVNTLSNGHISNALGIFSLAAIILIYESLGGIRSVVLTDALQGILLLITIQIIFFMVLYYYVLSPEVSNFSLSAISATTLPDGNAQIKWISTIMLVFFSVALYPQAVQRVLMAKSENALKKSLKFMAIAPLFTTLPLVFIAIIASAVLPNLDQQSSENVLLLMLIEINHFPWMHWVIVLFFSAALAAIMSTIDSSNLALNAIIIKNVYLKINPKAQNTHIMRMVKIISLSMLMLLSYLAVSIDSSIWTILKIKLEVLAQLFPAFTLGLWLPKLRAQSVFYGLIVGLTLIFYLLLFADIAKPLNIHAGLWGLFANVITIWINQLRKQTVD